MKKGNCFYITLQFMHDAGGEDDPLPKIFEMNGINRDQIPSYESLRLVHGEVVNLEGVYLRHAWIELGGIVIDWSNGNREFIRQEYYYRDHKVKLGRRFHPHEVFSILMDDPSPVYWGRLTNTQVAQTCLVYNAATYQGLERNFLEEYDSLP